MSKRRCPAGDDRASTATRRGRGWLLLVLLMPAVAQACTSVSGADTYSTSVSVRNEVAPNVVLRSWSANGWGAIRYGGCPGTQNISVAFTPQANNLTYVRHVNVDGTSYPAYGFSSTSPLVVFRHWKNSAGVGAQIHPMNMKQSNDFVVRTGSSGDLYAALEFAVVSRGGAMSSVARGSYKGATRLTGYSRVPAGQHDITFDINVPSIACTLSNASMSLPDVRPTALPTAGSTAGNSTLNVRMNCPSAGTTVKLTLTDANGNSGGTGQLTPTRDSTAAGARVRLLRGTTPVQFGTQWTHGASSAGDQSIAFTAQYIRTSGALQPGVLRGEATLTADYQ